jgi:hypothetical protein
MKNLKRSTPAGASNHSVTVLVPVYVRSRMVGLLEGVADTCVAGEPIINAPTMSVRTERNETKRVRDICRRNGFMKTFPVFLLSAVLTAEIP